MKTHICLFLLYSASISCSSVFGATAFDANSENSKTESMAQLVDRGLKRATSQTLILADALKDKKDALPRTYEKGKLQTVRYDHWVSGFFPGLCTAAFLPLGLPSTDSFWAAPPRDWTAKKAWNGVDVGADHAIR